MLVTAPFGAVGLLLVPLAVGTDTPLLRQVGPGLYWVVVLLFGVLVTLRAGMLDTGGQRDLLRLWGVTARIRLAGRTLANMVLLLVFQAALAPVAIALYDPDLTGWPWLLPVWCWSHSGSVVSARWPMSWFVICGDGPRWARC